MITAQMVAIFSTSVSFVSLLLVVFRQHKDAVQRRVDSLIRIYDINRQLVSLGFSSPKLFDILQDAPEVDPVWERRYLQLWLNQMALIHAYQKQGVLPSDLQVSLERDIRDFMAMGNMRRHWTRHRDYYPESFRSYLDGLLGSEKSE